MSDTYDLNDNVNESFTFGVGGHQYKMAYPTLEEIEQLQKMIADSQNKKVEERTSEDNFMEWTYQFISSVDQNSPPIGEIMKKQNIRVVINYTDMLKSEFGIE